MIRIFRIQIKSCNVHRLLWVFDFIIILLLLPVVSLILIDFFTSAIVKINKDVDLPAQICNNCVTRLDVAYRFRLDCESSDAIFQSLSLTECDSDSAVDIIAIGGVPFTEQEDEMILTTDYAVNTKDIAIQTVRKYNSTKKQIKRSPKNLITKKIQCSECKATFSGKSMFKTSTSVKRS